MEGEERENGGIENICEQSDGKNQIQTWWIMSIYSIPSMANISSRTHTKSIQWFIMCQVKLSKLYSTATPERVGKMHMESGHFKEQHIEYDGGDDKW